jgi:putrescine aminotransferase
MRHVGDRMVVSPPLVIEKSEIDTLIDRAWKALDLTHNQIKAEGLMKAAS